MGNDIVKYQRYSLNLLITVRLTFLYIQNEILGVGGETGLQGGAVSSPVAASKLIAWGYSGVAVFNPYRSFILREL